MKTLDSVLIVLTLASTAAAQQSVADAARQARATSHPGTATVRLDGDSMPRLATATSAEPDKAKDTEQPADAKTTDAKASDAKSADSKPADVKASGQQKPAAPPKPKAEEWTQKVEAEKKEIATLQRELDILQREQRLRAAAYYADAGARLRDQGKFDQDSRKEQEDIDAKKQALAEAQQKLDDLQEAARKAGVPTS